MNKPYTASFLERLVEALLLPLPTQISLVISDARGRQTKCEFSRQSMLANVYESSKPDADNHESSQPSEQPAAC